MIMNQPEAVKHNWNSDILSLNNHNQYNPAHTQVTVSKDDICEPLSGWFNKFGSGLNCLNWSSRKSSVCKPTQPANSPCQGRHSYFTEIYQNNIFFDTHKREKIRIFMQYNFFWKIVITKNQTVCVGYVLTWYHWIHVNVNLAWFRRKDMLHPGPEAQDSGPEAQRAGGL